MDGEAVYGELHLDSISDKAARDALRKAARAASRGETVWLVRRDGTRIGALVSVQRAGRSRAVLSNPAGTLDMDGPAWALARASGLVKPAEEKP